MATLVGKTLGKYTLTELLGRGGMAEVYKAYHPRLARTVKIKVLHGYLAEGEDFLARFEREARAVAALRHPHINQIYDYEVEDGTYYMVMEFVDGDTLQAKMNALSKSGTYLPTRQVLSILRQAAQALDYAHRQGIIHRDVKPSNILLDQSGDAFLTDFGIARLMGATQFTSTGALIGTPTYMSPEQGRGEELTGVSDVYSLGVILYELLTGRAPYLAETPLSIIYKHINEPLLRPGVLRPELPPEVEAVVEQALAKDPAARYQHAGAMVQALEQALTVEVSARLDASGAQPSIASVALPARRVDEQPELERARLPTVMMGEETRVEIAGLPAADETPMPEPAAVETTPVPVEKPARIGLLQRLRSRWVLATVIGLVLLAVLILALSGVFQKTGCDTVEQCIQQADQYRAQGDLDAYLTAIDAAARHVPLDQHPPYAGIWCDRGDVERQLGRVNDAIASYQQCFEWTQALPELQSLRDRASEGLNSLK